MKVVKVKTGINKERYYVADDDGRPIEPILKFIKFKDNTNYARNTLKSYCYHLKSYFEYLEEINLNFKDVTIDDLSSFVNWLQNPFKSLKVIPLNSIETARCERTINQMVNTVLTFYDYILRHEKYSNNVSERLKKIVNRSSKSYKGFLYGIAYHNRLITSNILKLKITKERPKTLTKEEVTTIIRSCNNWRDELLILLLFETGMRIGEALSLWIEDLDILNMQINLKDRGELNNNAEIKTVSSPRKIDISDDLLDAFMDYVARYHISEVETNHVFIKLSGKNKYKEMNYTDVNNLFRSLAKKAKFYVTPHIFRHTSLSLLSRAGWKPEHLKERAGHKNIYTTLNTYVHITDEDIAEEFEKVKSLFDLETFKSGDEK